MFIVDVPPLLERLGIVAKRRGREWWACCPFHAERTPSWQIHDDDQNQERHARWRCLGACHEGGSAVGLVMRLLGLERAREAYDWLRGGGAAERPSPGQKAASGGGLALGPARRPRLGFQLPEAIRFLPFEEWPTLARSYAVSRGLTAEQIDRWGIGIAVDGRLRGRIVMPWRDQSGRIGGYTARAYLPGEDKKYLEPKIEEGAAVGWIYGEELWPALEDRERLVVVEGGFDGFALERVVSGPWGAARGSNLVPGHIARFMTFAELVLLVDPDKAGTRFADAIVEAVGRHRPILRGVLPRGTDVAKLERRDPGALERVIRSAA